MNRSQKRVLGQLFWFLVALFAAYTGFEVASSPADHADARHTFDSVGRFLSRSGDWVTLEDRVGMLRVGDPVFLAERDSDQGDGEERFRQVGRVSAVRPEENLLDIVWYEPGIGADECQLFQHYSSGRLSEVVETMMPPEKRKRIQKRVAAAVAEHGETLTDSFVPLVRETLKRSLPVIEAEFKASVARHRSEIDAAVGRWNDEVIERRLVPLAKREILPIVQKHGQPPAEEIGREIWDRASLWRFGWRALYDKTPLPRKDLVQEEWQRFVTQEAVPVLESHMDEIVVAIQRSLQDIAANEAVRNEIGSVADEIVSDRESRQLIQSILKEALVDNERLKQVWTEVWSSQQAEEAFAVAGDRLEPVVREIGDELFGSEEQGIDPNFARVLRSQILRKDRRWIVAWHTGAGNGCVELSSKSMPYPLVYLADQD